MASSVSPAAPISSSRWSAEISFDRTARRAGSSSAIMTLIASTTAHSFPRSPGGSIPFLVGISYLHWGAVASGEPVLYGPAVPAGLDIEPTENPAGFRVAGDLDVSTVDVLTDALDPALEAGGDLTLDLAAVHFVDSTGL